jgi:endo-1,4-beta-xylanase
MPVFSADAGVEIDALGLQSHMHQGYWAEERALETLARFERFGLPVHLTETTLVSGHLMPPGIDDLKDYQVAHRPSTPEGEERQAQEVVRHYTSLFGHPAVHSATYWCLNRRRRLAGRTVRPGACRRHPQAGLRAAGALVRGEWWLVPTTVRTDAEGRFALEAYLGAYTVATGGSVAERALAPDTPRSTARPPRAAGER